MSFEVVNLKNSQEVDLHCSINGERCQWKDSQSEQNCKNCSYLIKDCKTKDFDPEIPDRALRYNEGKLQWGLVHYKSLEPMVRALEFGAKKYAPNNWMKPMNTREILESMQRHLSALMDGELIDKESGISHMGHIQCNALFFNYHIDNKDND